VVTGAMTGPRPRLPGNFPARAAHYWNMDCDSAREAVSARIDGEDLDAPDALEAHLTTCADCRQWQQRAHAVTRRVRLGGVFLDHDLAPLVRPAVPAGRPWWRRGSAQRAVLLAVGLAQLTVAVPMLFLGLDHDGGVHAAHELGSFNLALAVAFIVGAVWPRLSAGLVWPCAIASVGLVGTAVADLFSGQAIGADEAQHLIAVAGAALLGWQARTPGRVTAPAAEGTEPSRPVPATMPVRMEFPPQPPGGHAAWQEGHAAWLPATAQPGRGEGRSESVA
jgi:predicted anti-sigma-YlaC factor YlaD